MKLKEYRLNRLYIGMFPDLPIKGLLGAYSRRCTGRDGIKYKVSLLNESDGFKVTIYNLNIRLAKKVIKKFYKSGGDIPQIKYTKILRSESCAFTD